MLREFDEDTIAAISTPPGEGGIGIIRLSGPRAILIADQVFRSSKKMRVKDQPAFTAQHGYILAKNNFGQSEKVDEVLVLLMRAPKSYTCEDVVEISAHGGSAVTQAILDLLIKEGARLAAKGEFTKRAFLNGRIDLLQAEAVLDLIKAKTELGRRWATAQLEGVLSQAMKAMKDELVTILSHLEASIDFPDDSIDSQSLKEMADQLNVMKARISSLLSSSSLGFIAKNGLKVVIAGRPNVGKSSLMNRLTGMDRVIVTSFPGTTRDTVEAETQIQGFLIRIVDTAGIQRSDHPIEKEGIERSKAAVAESDLVLYVLDAGNPWSLDDGELLRDLADKQTIVVLNKCDLPRKLDIKLLKPWVDQERLIEISCTANIGLELLEKAIVSLIKTGNSLVYNDIIVTTVRQKDTLEKMFESIKNAGDSAKTGLSPELVAVDVRLALDHLGALVGEVVTNDILEVLFSQFCIGK